MSIKRPLRILALILVLLICTSFYVSTAYIVHHADHECTGEDCEICKNIQFFTAMIQNLFRLFVALTVAFFLVGVSNKLKTSLGSELTKKRTALYKVKFSN